jgi:prevent-host-death family protein
MNRQRRTTGTHKGEWQLQDAKARFSELFRLAHERGPQRVTKHGRSAVVVLPAEEYDRLVQSTRSNTDIAQFFASSPLAKARLQFERSRDYGRRIDL